MPLTHTHTHTHTPYLGALNLDKVILANAGLVLGQLLVREGHVHRVVLVHGTVLVGLHVTTLPTGTTAHLCRVCVCVRVHVCVCMCVCVYMCVWVCAHVHSVEQETCNVIQCSAGIGTFVSSIASTHMGGTNLDTECN